MITYTSSGLVLPPARVGAVRRELALSIQMLGVLPCRTADSTQWVTPHTYTFLFRAQLSRGRGDWRSTRRQAALRHETRGSRPHFKFRDMWHSGRISRLLDSRVPLQGRATACRGGRRAERLTRHETLFHV